MYSQFSHSLTLPKKSTINEFCIVHYTFAVSAVQSFIEKKFNDSKNFVLDQWKMKQKSELDPGLLGTLLHYQQRRIWP